MLISIVSVVHAQDAIPGEYIVSFDTDSSPNSLSQRIENLREEIGSRPSVEDQIEELKQRLHNFEHIKNETNTENIEFDINSNSDEDTSFYLIKTAHDQDPKHVIQSYSSITGVESVVPNYIITKTAFKANDPLFSQQWNLVRVGAPSTWELTEGSSTTRVAIIDTGINYNHEDISSVRIVDDYDFVNQDDDALDDEGHGTLVSGLIMAQTNNGKGISGLDHNTQILNYKVLDENGSGSFYNLMQAINRAIDNQADIINMSLSANISCSRYSLRSFRSILSDANKDGVVVVAAVGNNNINVRYVTPASCNYVISVGATNFNDGLTYYSNYGSSLDIVAPGGNVQQSILSTELGNTYKNSYGTSFSAPHVTAAASLLKGLDNTLNPDEIESIMINTADSISHSYYSYPRLNIYQAVLSLTENPAPQPTATPPTTEPTSVPTATPTPTVTPTPTPTPTPTQSPIVAPSPTPSPPPQSLPWWCKYIRWHYTCRI